MVQVEHRKHAVTSENEGLKKDLESARTAHDVAVRDKAEVEKACEAAAVSAFCS
jgi:hypothetical protein